MSTFDPKDLRRAFGSFMTGVTVVTTRDTDGTPVGFTANSFTSVSLDPPLLLVCPGNHLSSFDVFARTDQFAVSILAEGQEAQSNLFAKSGTDRFAQADWQDGPNGMPLINGRSAGFSCRVAQRLPAGDHLVLMGEVQSFDHSGLPGLGYGQGGYFSLSAERQAQAPAKGIAQAILERDGAVWLTQDGQLPGAEMLGRSGAQAALERQLETLGIQATLGPVYSVYDSADTGQHHVVFRGTLDQPTPHLRPLPLDHLPAADGTAQSTLLARYRQEHRNQSFGLYVGDARDGDIHTPNKG